MTQMLTRIVAVATLALGVAAQQFPAAEAKALELKGQGRYAEARDAFLTLLSGVADDANGAALAEYYAVMAHEMTQHLGDWTATRAAFARAADGPLAAKHPALKGALRLLQLQIDMRRGDLAETMAGTQACGFLTHWWVIG